MDEQVELQDILQQWSFPWPIMDVLIGGRSAVDLDSLHLQDEADARQFLKSYGYDPELPSDLQRLNAIFIEAVHFIEARLMPAEWAKGQRPPLNFLHCEKPTQLLLWAAGNGRSMTEKSDMVTLQAWSCAVLRIMHTIAHLDDLQRLNNIQEARHQIMERFQKVLFLDERGRLLFGSKKQYIALEKVEWKTRKSRNSMLLKLLHKPANVSETIYDFVGVRIVTKTLSDAMIAVKFLRQFYLVDFANTHPGRSRNNLIDTREFRSYLETLTNLLEKRQITKNGFLEMVSCFDNRMNQRKTGNPHSSREYKAIQLTCRQRVRYPDPALTYIDKLESYLQAAPENQHSRKIIEAFLTLISAWSPTNPGLREVSIFFPFEVQILDRQAARSVEKGSASHDCYKKAQIRSARKRILGKVLALG